jgi:hypothetical protein
MMTFGQFFGTATGHAPYDYQRRLAVGDAGRACESQLINVPTGLSKADKGYGASGKAERFLLLPAFPRSLTRLGPSEIMVQFGCGVWTLNPPPGQEALELRTSATGHFSRLAKRKRASGVQRAGEFLFQLGLHFQRRHPQSLHRFVGNLNRQRHLPKHTACPEENKPQRGRARLGAEEFQSLSRQNTQNQLQRGRAGGKRTLWGDKGGSLRFSKFIQKPLNQGCRIINAGSLNGFYDGFGGANGLHSLVSSHDTKRPNDLEAQPVSRCSRLEIIITTGSRRSKATAIASISSAPSLYVSTAKALGSGALITSIQVPLVRAS